MGRFRDLWTSGKFFLKARENDDAALRQNALANYQERSPELAVPDRSLTVLEALKTRRGVETGRWLRELNPVASPPVQISAPVSDTNVFEDVVVLVDLLFSEFVELAYEFNKSAIGTELLVSCLKPTVFAHAGGDEWYRSSVNIYQGRLTTKEWTLITRGGNGKVAIFLLPSPMWLAFTAGQVSEKDYPPFMELIQFPEGIWKLAGEQVALSAVKRLAKELLGDLIRVSSGVMAESELFSRGSSLPSLGETVAIGFLPGEPVIEAESGTAPIVLAGIGMPEACDIVDGIIDRELKRLYLEAVSLKSTSSGADAVRKHISAVEGFRIKMLEAFEEYTELTLPLHEIREDKPQAPELLRP